MKLFFGGLGLFLLGTSFLCAEPYVACKQTQQLGLFEQCEEVKIMKALGDQTRVYSLARNKLLSWKTSNLYKASKLSAREKVNAEDLLVVPGQLLWASSTKFHQTLCKPNPAGSPGEVLSLNCGKDSAQKINRQLVYKLTSVPVSAPVNPSYQSKK